MHDWNKAGLYLFAPSTCLQFLHCTSITLHCALFIVFYCYYLVPDLILSQMALASSRTLRNVGISLDGQSREIL